MHNASFRCPSQTGRLQVMIRSTIATMQTASFAEDTAMIATSQRQTDKDRHSHPNAQQAHT